MTTDGILEVSRSELADLLNVAPRTIDRYLASGIEHEWLQKLRSGKHRTAIHQAMIPSPFRLIEGGRQDESKRATTGAYGVRETRQTPARFTDHETRHLVARSYIEGERSEHVALDITARHRNRGRVDLRYRRDLRTPLGSQRGQLLGRGVISTIPNRNPGKHASSGNNSRSVIAGFAFVSARVATTEGAA